MSKFAQKKRHLHDCVVSRITAPKDIHVLEFVNTLKKEFVSIIKVMDLEMGTLSCIFHLGPI